MKNKLSEATRVMSRVLLEAPLGGRIPTTLEFVQRAGVGVGTVHSALYALEEAGAIAVTSHGASGRILRARDSAALWQYGELPLVGSMPHPQSREFDALAAALSRGASSRDIALQLWFRQGSSARLRSLHEGKVDFVALSLGAARVAEGIHYIQLPPHTFYAKDSVVVITPSGSAPRYSGVVPADLDSYDHQWMSRNEFAQCQLSHVPYQLIPERIANGEFHSAIWHKTSDLSLSLARGLSVHPLNSPAQPFHETLSVASLAWREGDAAIANLLEDVLSREKFVAILRELALALPQQSTIIPYSPLTRPKGQTWQL